MESKIIYLGTFRSGKFSIEDIEIVNTTNKSYILKTHLMHGLQQSNNGLVLPKTQVDQLDSDQMVSFDKNKIIEGMTGKCDSLVEFYDQRSEDYCDRIRLIKDYEKENDK